MRIILLGLALAGCKADDLLADLPDAAVDADPLPDGYDWSCVEDGWPTVAPEVLPLSGNVIDLYGAGVGGPTVDILDLETTAVLATGTAGTSPVNPGAYSIELETDGTAPSLIRRATRVGRVDGYMIDAAPISYPLRNGPNIVSPTPDQVDGFYASLGVARTPGRALVYVTVLDCEGTPVEGATIDLPGAAAFSYQCADQSFGTECLELTETSANGAAMALDVPAGTIDVTVQVGGHTYRSWPIRVFADAMVTAPRLP